MTFASNTYITDIVFADDTYIFDKTLEVLLGALESLHEQVNPLGLKVSWPKTKVDVFGGLLDEAVRSVHACGVGIDNSETFTYPGSVVHDNGGSRHEVLRRIGLVYCVMDSINMNI